MRYPTYPKVEQAMKHVNPDDDSYCTVVAVAQATDCSLSKAYHTCKAAGRKDRKGMYTKEHVEMIRNMGFNVDEVDDVMGLTVNKAIKHLNDSEGTYLFYILGHVMVYREGFVRDWHQLTHVMHGKAIRKRIMNIYKVTKK